MDEYKKYRKATIVFDDKLSPRSVSGDKEAVMLINSKVQVEIGQSDSTAYVKGEDPNLVALIATAIRDIDEVDCITRGKGRAIMHMEEPAIGYMKYCFGAHYCVLRVRRWYEEGEHTKYVVTPVARFETEEVAINYANMFDWGAKRCMVVCQNYGMTSYIKAKEKFGRGLEDPIVTFKDRMEMFVPVLWFDTMSPFEYDAVEI